jgi:hypothetical protein
MQKYSTVDYLLRVHWCGVINGPEGSRVAICTSCGPLFASLREDSLTKQERYEAALEVARAHATDNQGFRHD